MNNPENVRVLCGLQKPQDAAQVPVLQPFAPQSKTFLSDLSSALLRDKAAHAYPDVISFAFFCRHAHLELLEKSYDDLDTRLGKGLVFHIAPGNVPMNFAYSLVSALLAGNASIVKAPSKPFEQVRITCDLIQALLDSKHQAMKPYINVIEYPREQQSITETFSAVCDVRIIWGGDETIRRVRMAPLLPRAFDITFADRWSIAVLKADAILAMQENELNELATGFYNDTYLYDQNACTSPRLCVWIGEKEAVAAAKDQFWSVIYQKAASLYRLDTLTIMDKYTECFRAAILLNQTRKERTKDNLLYRLHVDTLTPEVMNLHCSGGSFLEYEAQGLSELVPILSNKIQTLSCVGFEGADIRTILWNAGVKGVDRIVKIGHTMDFSLLWDGYDLIRALSRKLG